MGGQLGSSSCFGDCIAAPQKYLSRRFAVSGGSAQARRFGGHPHSKPASKEIATSASKWWVLKRVFRDKKCEWAKTKINSISSAKNFQTKSWKFTSRKLQKRKVNLNPQNSWPQKTVWVRGRKSRTRNCYLEPEPQRKNQTQHAPRILMPTCCTSYVRDWRKRRRYATRADRLVRTETISSAYRKHGAVC